MRESETFQQADGEFSQLVRMDLQTERGWACWNLKSSIKFPLTILLLIILIGATERPFFAQGTSGSISGSVTDEAGSLIVGAEVTINNEQTGLQHKAVTNSQGFFEFAFLPIGQYSVTASYQGFRTSKVIGIKLEVNQKVRADIALKVGHVAETVTVEGTTLIATGNSAIGQVVTGDQINNLPLNNRQFLGLVTLVPGTVPAPRDFRSTEPGGRGVVIPSSNGGRPEDNSYSIDGIDNREIGFSNYAISPSIDSIAEFKVTTGMMSADQGRVASSAIEVVTKSGTNKFHGSAFEFLRNNAFDARNFFAKKVDSLKRNQFGGSIGGPIVRNNHFVFAAFERFIERAAGAPVVGSVPTLTERQGIFSQTLRDPLNGNQPFASNTIPPGRIDPISAKVLAFIPLPNSSDLLRNFIYTRDPTKTNKYLLSVRMDLRLTEKSQLSGRYILDDEKILQAPVLPTGTGGVNFNIRAQGISIQEVHIFSPNLVNQALAGWTGFNYKQADNFAGVKNIASELGINLTGLGDDPSGWAFPATTISGFLAPSGTFPRPRDTKIYQFSDTISITHGSHDIRTGGEVKRYHSDLFSPGQLNGFFDFEGTFTGNSFADFLLGWPLSAFRNINPARQNGGVTYYGAFVSDDWKVSDQLTLNLGLRYEIETVLKEDQNEVARFDLATGRVLFPEAARSRVEPFFQQVRPDVPFGFYSGDLYKQDKNNFGPRLGFAYRPFAHKNNTVIRGGFGIFYNAPQLSSLLASVSVPPFSIRPTETSVSSFPQLRWNPAGGFTQALQGPLTFFGFLQQMPYAYDQQWALTLQRGLGRELAVEIGYIGSHTLRMISQLNVNVPPPGFGDVLARSPYPQWARVAPIYSGFSSKYNSLQVKVEKRATTGLSFLAAYTFSKTIDQVSQTNAEATGYPIPLSTRMDLITGRADFDVRHRFSFSYNYEFPFGPGRSFLNGAEGLARHLVQGWGIRGITTLQSGYPVDVTMSSARLNSGPGIVPRPYRIADGNLPASQRTLNRWFDTSAFPLPPLFTIGNAGRNVITGPGYNNFDLAIFKNTHITESQRLELRAEFFNVLNHPNFGLPGGNASTPATFGVITSALPPRIIQLGVKYYF